MATNNASIYKKYGLTETGEKKKNGATPASGNAAIYAKYGLSENGEKQGATQSAPTFAVTPTRVAQNSNAPASSGYTPARNIIDQLDRQQAHQQALTTERADELDKQNVESATRAQNSNSGNFLGTLRRVGQGILSGLTRRGANYAADAAVVADNQGGTAMRGVYQDQVDMLNRQIEALENTLNDPTMTERDILETQEALRIAREQLGIYSNAVRSNENTAAGVYETVDAANRYAQQKAEQSVAGTSGLGRAALSLVPGLTELGLDVGASALVPLGNPADRLGLGLITRGLGAAGSSMTDYRYRSGEDYNPVTAANRGLIAGGGVLAGSVASNAVNNGVLKLLKNKGLQNNVIPAVLQNGLAATAYTGGDVAMSELARATTEDDYTPDWSQIGGEAASAFAFGVITGFINVAATSGRNKAYMRELNSAVQKRYEYAKSIIENPAATAEQRAAGASSVMDAIDQLRYALDDMQVVGAAGEVKDIQEFLLSVYGEMLPYATQSAGVLGTPTGPLAPVTPPTTPATVRQPTQPEPPVVPQAPAPAPTAPATAGMAAASVQRTPEITPTPTPPPAPASVAQLVEQPKGNLTPEETKPTTVQKTGNTEAPKPLQPEPHGGTIKGRTTGPTDWGNVINGERVSGLSKSEQTAVKNIFETPKQQTAAPAQRAENPQQQIADDVRRSIEKGIAFNSARLFEIADKAYGGTQAQGAYTVKDAYDGMELAVNQHLMSADFVKAGNGDLASAKKTLSALQDLLGKLPTQTKRGAEQESFQQFSTPPTIAYLAAWAANVGKGDVALEPSAGIGGLALWPKAWGAKVYGNELSERRLAFLNQLGLDGTFNLNAEQINNLLPDSIKPTVVLMNPPFSSTAGRTATNHTANAKRHIEQALDRLEDGGRLVAILGRGMSDDATAFRRWWNDLRTEYNIRANVRIDGENYRKYGTTFDVQLVVIDKTGAQTGETITGEYKDLAEIPNILEGIRNDRTRLEAAPRAEQNTPVNGLQSAGAQPVGNGAVSRAGVERGTAGERAGMVEQKPDRPLGTKALEEHAGDIGQRTDVPAAGTLQDADNQRGVGGRRNERQRSLEDHGGANGAQRQAAGAVGDGAGEHGKLRLQSERSLPSNQLAKEAAEHPDSIYSTYAPRKARIKGAKPHPAKLVESAAMAAVEPPDVTYTPNLPESIVTGGVLSDAQLENVIYAGQAHAQKLPNGQRKGFFIGDGTGVGKGRQISGIIMDNFRQGRNKAVWISENAALINDAVRDWTALGGKAEDVIDLKKIKYKTGGKINADSGILFSSYDTLKTDKDARIRLLRDWLGKDFDGVIALDEAHNMGNAAGKKGVRGRTKPSAKAIAGIELQDAFPNARVVYASATGATEASNYAYLQRLGLWGKGTAFNDFNDFMSKISNGGLAAMELVARDMKAMGEYMARSISYDDVKYDTLQHDLTPMQTEIYNTMSQAWQKVMQNVNAALEITGQQNDGTARGRAMSAIFGTQQRFYNQILTSMSMPSVIEDMKKELAAGRSCVLQLVNTNAAAADRAIAKNADGGGDLDDLDLTPSDMLIQMVQNSFPVQLFEEYTDENGAIRSRPVLDAEGKPVIDKKAVKLRDALIEDLKMMKVPDGPLEMLFDAFGEENVAEVTGRTRRVVEKLDESGNRKRVIERRSGNSGIADANMFQDGKKRILVFSNAGGTGRSYHADLTTKNQQQRVHYLLQPGWEASKAVQGFGRTHRSNQANAPIFRLITTNVMGQKRFTSTIARRLDQLGALTKGQRQAGSGVFGEKDNLENPIAMDALSQYYRTVSPETLKKLGLYDKIYDEFGRFNDKSDTLRDIGKFLNRILALEVDEQNEVFQGFYDTFDRFMDTAIANGTVDMGLENYRADKIEVVDENVIRKDSSGADTKYVQMTVYRKPEITPFSKVKTLHDKYQGMVRTEDGNARAVYEISSKTNPKTGEIQRRFKLEGPVRNDTSTYVEETLKNKTTPIPKDEWKEAWAAETAKAPEYNTSTLHMLTGTLLPIWDRLPQENTRVMRVLPTGGTPYLGRVIRPDQIDSVLRGLGAHRTMKQYSVDEIKDGVLKAGQEAAFTHDRLRLVRSRVSGDWRMELVGPNVWYMAKRYPHLIAEKIAYQTRYFIPDNAAGNAILGDILKNNPVLELRKAAPQEVDNFQYATAAGSTGTEWEADRIKGGEAKEQTMSLSEIVEKIRHDFSVNVTTGHVRGAGVMGQYNRSNRGIRSRLANDLPTISHELGHHLDNTYGLREHLTPEMIGELQNGLGDAMRASYAPKKWTTEGIAEYFRKYLQNRETAAIDYPTFTAYVKGLMSGKDAALLDQIADEVNAYFSMDVESATSSIRFREDGRPDARTYAEKIHDKYDVLYQQWVDSNHGIKLYADETGDPNSYRLATNAAYRDAMAGAIITGDLTDANGQYVGPGLGTVLHGVNLKDKKEYRLFGEYLTVKHGPERLREGMRIFADDRKNSSKWMMQRQAELEEQFPEFKAASERLYQFIGDLYKVWGVDTGLIAEDTLKQWRERWQYYVPLNRAVSVEARGRGARRGFANQNSTVRQARGSGLDIVHPVDNIINNLVLLVNAGVQNNVMRSITDAAETLGADAAFLEKVPTPMRKAFFDATGIKKDLADIFNDSSLNESDKAFVLDTIGNIEDIVEQYKKGKAFGDVITVMKGGNQEFWKINDPLLLSSLTNMTPNQRGGILNVYGAITRFMTSAITGNNIVWGIFSNFPRDLQTLFTYSADRNPLHMLGGIGSAYVNKFKGNGADPLYKEFLAMGGGQTSVYTADRDLAKKARAKLSGSKLQWLNPMEWLAFVSDTIESGPRYATYKVCRDKGMTPQEAIYAAHDITVNFRKAGPKSREINKVIPFFNAGVQGLDKFARWASADDAPLDSRKATAAKRFTAYLAVMAAVGTLFYALNNSDEEAQEDYHQLSNYTKNSYWLIPLGEGKYFAIPKARELSVVSSFFETLAEYTHGRNKHAFEEFWSYAADNFLPSVVSDIVAAPETGLAQAGYGAMSSLGIIGVVGSILANRDYLGRPIVSASMQYYEKKDQYNRRTSKLAKVIGEAFNVSPMEVDYFFQQTLGGYWKAQKALFPVGGENIDLTLGVQNSYIKDNQYSTDLLNWLYDKATASAAAKKSDPGNMGKAITAAMDDRMTSFYSRYYKLAKDNPETTAERGTRQIVLDMIAEYQKAADNDYISETQRMIYAVCEREGATDYLPSTMQSTVKDGNKAEHLLSDIQYVEYQTDYLRQYYEYVEATLPNAKDDREQVAILKAAKDMAKIKATDRVLKRIGAPTGDTASKYGTVDDTNVILFKAALDLANDDGGLSQQEVIDAIDALNLSRSQSSTLFHTKYDSDKNNPYK